MYLPVYFWTHLGVRKFWNGSFESDNKAWVPAYVGKSISVVLVSPIRQLQRDSFNGLSFFFPFEKVFVSTINGFGKVKVFSVENGTSSWKASFLSVLTAARFTSLLLFFILSLVRISWYNVITVSWLPDLPEHYLSTWSSNADIVNVQVKSDSPLANQTQMISNGKLSNVIMILFHTNIDDAQSTSINPIQDGGGGWSKKISLPVFPL